MSGATFLIWCGEQLVLSEGVFDTKALQPVLCFFEPLCIFEPCATFSFIKFSHFAKNRSFKTAGHACNETDFFFLIDTRGVTWTVLVFFFKLPSYWSFLKKNPSAFFCPCRYELPLGHVTQVPLTVIHVASYLLLCCVFDICCYLYFVVVSCCCCFFLMNYLCCVLQQCRLEFFGDFFDVFLLFFLCTN